MGVIKIHFDNQYIDEINQRNPLKDIILEYSGQEIDSHSSVHKVKCPLPSHVDTKTPSFAYYNDQDTAYCYGCNTFIGNSIDYLIQTEGLHFRDAVIRLAERANMDLPDDDSEISEEIQLRKDLKDKAKSYWKNIKSNEKVLDYLYSRGITDKTINKFGIGYCTNPKGKEFQKFNKRIIFPIFDEYSRLMGFAGRVLPGNDDRPKYVNSSPKEIPFFDKSNILYGLNLAKNNIGKKKFMFAFEGYTDVNIAHQHGVTNSCSFMGTAITENHIAKIKDITDTVIFYLDSDDAGLKSVTDNLSSFEDVGITVKIVFDNNGMDPAEKIHDLKGDFESWALSNAKTPEHFYTSKALDKYYERLNNAKRDLMKELAKVFGERQSSFEQEIALQSVCSELNLDINTLKKTIGIYQERVG